MHGTPLPAQLAGPPLNDRDAIADACYRSFASIDHADKELLLSSVAPDVCTEIAGKICSGADELVTKVWENVSYKIDTIHYLTNMRVNVDTPTTGRVTFTRLLCTAVLARATSPATSLRRAPSTTAMLSRSTASGC